MSIDKRVKKMTASLVALRRFQDQTDALFLASMGKLSLPQLNVLNTIGDHDTCTMGDIAKCVSLSLSSVTLIVDKLTKAKLVTRVRSKNDRRIVFAKLTSEGNKIYQVQLEHLNRMGQKLLATLEDQEQENLINILEKLTALPETV